MKPAVKLWKADALHFSSDIWSSMVVLFGLVFVAFGMNKADAIAAIGVAIFVVYVGYKLGKRTIDVLIDTAPKDLPRLLLTRLEKLRVF